MAAALICVTTSSLKVPMLATGGYLNLGDAVVIFLAFLLGPRHGAMAAGVGSAAADFLGGYASFAGITFVAKGSEAWIAARLGPPEASWLRRSLGAGLAGVVMAGWYLLWESLVLGSGPALASLPGNLFQGLAGAIGALMLLRAAWLPRPAAPVPESP